VKEKESDALSAALAVLSPTAAEAVAAAAALGGGVQEIRLYRGGTVMLVRRGVTVRTSAVCGESDFDGTFRRLCGNSLYAHGDTIRDGYIYCEDGLRVGVCGRAVTENGRIVRVTDIASLCIRLPVRVPGAADALLPYILRDGAPGGMLIWSPPGVGKTTVLRELAAALSAPEHGLRCAIVDTRQELGWGIDGDGIDILCGYPRAAGMEIAVRTLSPQVVICDEIFTEADADAVLYCAASGVSVIASAHAACRGDLHLRPPLRRVIGAGAFPALVGLSRTADGIVFDISEGGV